MKTVCSRHGYAYEVSQGCPWCEPTPASVVQVLSLEALFDKVRATRRHYVRIHVSENTYRAFLSDLNSDWIDIYVEIRDGYDLLGYHLAGMPVPPPHLAVAGAFGSKLHIDPSVPDNEFLLDP